MKALFALAVLLVTASCQVYPMNVGNECSTATCSISYWQYNNTNFNYTCPEAGKSMARFRIAQGNYFLDFVAYNPLTSDSPVTIPLFYNPNPNQSGLQYYYSLQQGHNFVILNCTLTAAKQLTSLCSKHALVGGKIYKDVFQNACAFGLDAPRYAFLQQEIPLEFESSI
ncbi:hypothetical protein TTHERM_01062900 (macronuclear) [Tetrahymena thermophila SB210]|uniref:Transmembrane protein n=1 Tax=Tetrahymena thermophila (strain SB210) TaxID=312017 RepID=Q22KV6_TETTS|nr:hypothetical protein TTHERM_01062900 [Tetrahymena thermophila SB210]EAR85922.1 hypothetical protein TTHERM_01062900 [Tetrahymena thermophila SB210]|eukprot:XP_976517.1 hypothetical protein TTHERM_01062900 [Tetrahymena thermophila SB210]